MQIDLDKLAAVVAARPRSQKKPARSRVNSVESWLWDAPWARLEVYNQAGTRIAIFEGPEIPREGRRAALLMDRYSRAVAFLRAHNAVGNVLALVRRVYKDGDPNEGPYTGEKHRFFRRERPEQEEATLWTSRYSGTHRAGLIRTISGKQRLTLSKKR